MRKVIMVVVAMTWGLCSQAAMAVSFSPLEIYGSISIGALMSGGQRDFPDSYLAPTPDSYGASMPFIGLRVFFFEQAGIEAFCGIGGEARASSSQVSSSLALYNLNTVNGGLIFRYNFSPRPSGWLAILAGGGVSYQSPSMIARDFQMLGWDNGDSIGTSGSDLGWYTKVGFAYYFGTHFFVDLTTYYIYSNVKSDPPMTKFDGSYLLFAFGIGFAIF
jgi:hypothetical protein